MQIEHISRSAVKITMSPSELEAADITVTQAGRCSRRTAELLRGMANISGSGLKQPEKGKMFAEAFPMADGSCIFYLSDADMSLAEEKYRRFIISADTKERLFECAGAVKESFGTLCCESSLYCDAYFFRLTLRVPFCEARVRSALPENTSVSAADEIITAYLSEHCRLIISSGAAEKLCDISHA